MGYLQIPSTWKRVEDQQTIDFVHSVMNLVEEKGWARYCQTPCPRLKGIYVTKRETYRNLGTCTYERADPWENVYDLRDFAIRLNPVLFRLPTEKRNSIIIHELAHAYTRGNHHGADWQWLNEVICQNLGYNISPRLDNDAEISAELAKIRKAERQRPKKYAIQCPVCGYTWEYATVCQAVQHPERLQHKTCKVPLKRVR